MKKLLILFALVACFIIGGNHDTAFALSSNVSDYSSYFRTENGTTRQDILNLNFDFSNCYVIHGLGPGDGSIGYYKYRWIFISSPSPYYIAVNVDSSILTYPSVYFDDNAQIVIVTAEFKSPIHNGTTDYPSKNISIALNYINNNVIDSSCEEISVYSFNMYPYQINESPFYRNLNHSNFGIKSKSTFYQTSIGHPQCIVGRSKELLFEYLSTGNYEETSLYYNGILRSTYMPEVKANILSVTNNLAWGGNSTIQNAQGNQYPYGNKWRIKLDHVSADANYKFVFKIALPDPSFITTLKITQVKGKGIFKPNPTYALEYGDNYVPEFNLTDDGNVWYDSYYRYRFPVNSSQIYYKQEAESYSITLRGSQIISNNNYVDIDLSSIIESRTRLQNLYGNDIKTASVLGYITEVWTYVTETNYDQNKSWYGDVKVFRVSFQDFPKDINHLATLQNSYADVLPPVSTEIQNPNNNINDTNIEDLVDYTIHNSDTPPSDPDYNSDYAQINNDVKRELDDKQDQQIYDKTNGDYSDYNEWFHRVTEPDSSVNMSVFDSVSDLALSASKLSDVLRNFLSFLPPQVMSMIIAVFIVMVPLIVIKIFM